jgi:hypothetical protein
MPSSLNPYFEDKQIDDIRALTATKDDHIPFLLLPVRLETRFMESEKIVDISSSPLIDNIIKQSVDLHLKLSSINEKSHITKHGPDINQRISGLTRQIGALKNITNNEKQLLLQVNEIIHGNLTQLSGNYGKALLRGTSIKASNFNDTIHKIPTQPATIGTGANKLLEAVKVFYQKINVLTNRKILPYQNVKNKKQFFNFINTETKACADFLKNYGDLIKDPSFIPDNQCKSILQYISLAKKAYPQVIATLQGVYKGIGAQGSLDTFIKSTIALHMDEIGNNFARFEADINAYINKRLPAYPVNNNQLIVNFTHALLITQNFNRSSAQKYEDIKNFRQSLTTKLNLLGKTLENKISIDKGQHEQLQQVFGQLSGELQQVKTKITNYQSRNKSQKYGLDVFSSYLGSGIINSIESAIDHADIKLVKVKVYELWVRIYPDDIFVHTHEEALTVAEEVAGKMFWGTWWVAGGNTEIEKSGWKRLVDTFGTRRASWIVNVLDPRKINSALNVKNTQHKPFGFLNTALLQLKQLLEKVNKTNPSQPIADYLTNISLAQLNEINNLVQSVIVQTKNIAYAPINLLDKTKVELLKILGSFEILIAKIEKDETTLKQYFAAKLQSLQNAFTAITRLSNTFGSIEALTIEAILEKTGSPFDFSTVNHKDNSWTTAPHTYMMPDQFVAVTMKDNKFLHVVAGNKINQHVQLGLDPALFSNKDEDGEDIYKLDSNGDLQIEKGLRWMVDYNEALNEGMAVNIPLTEDQYNAGFDKVLVLGIKGTDFNNSATLLQDLLTNHIYAPDGMSILRYGTPTNNTGTITSGFSSIDDDSDERFDIEVSNLAFNESETNTYKKSDAKWLADMLGIAPSILQKLNNKRFEQIGHAYAVNRALWHSTMGTSMEEMWDNVFTYDNIKNTEDFFTKYCLGNGTIPPVRIGKQPYGILATTAYSRLKLYKDFDISNLPVFESTDYLDDPIHRSILEDKKRIRFELRLQQVLQTLNAYWVYLRKSKVNDFEKLKISSNPQQTFMDMLGLSAHSQEYFQRFGLNVIRSGDIIDNDEELSNFQETKGALLFFSLFKDMMYHATFSPSFVFKDEDSTLPNFKLEDERYSRIRDQFALSSIFRYRFVKPAKELKELTGDQVNPNPSFDNFLDPVTLDSQQWSSYIDWILDSSMDHILAGNNPAKMPSRSLLFLLLRQSLMTAYREAALDILQMEKLISEDFRRTLGDQNTYLLWNRNDKTHHFHTKWHLLLKDFDELDNDFYKNFNDSNPFYKYLKSANAGGRCSMAVYINKPDSNPVFSGYANSQAHRELLRKVDSVRAAISELKTIPTAELEMLLSQNLDMATYRIDTWFNAFVNKRLFDHRKQNPSGIHLGAYGWVENLKRNDQKNLYDTAKIPEELRPTSNNQVYYDPGNEGFIHASSINHAITAAVLRSAYKANYLSEDINNRLAVNLSSSRVRMALNIIDGVRNGLEVGATLGCQFERGLHERYVNSELDKFIKPFRDAFPLQLPVNDSGNVDQPVYISNVVNGVALLNKIFDDAQWLDFPAHETLYDLLVDNANQKFQWLKDIVIQNKGTEVHYNQIALEIDRMADSFDSLGDLVISESVYQIVQGNHVRASAMLTSLAEGKNIPDPQIIDTPRTGKVVTHRIIINIRPLPVFVNPVEWQSAVTPRALAEPSLNNWLANMIGNPANIFCTIWKEDNSLFSQVSLADLDIQPLDYLYLTSNAEELKQYIGFKSGTSNQKVTIDLKSRLPQWDKGIRTFCELDFLMDQLRAIIQQGRAASALDFTDSNNSVYAEGFDINQLQLRVSNAYQNFKTSIFNILNDSDLYKIIKQDSSSISIDPTEKLQLNESQAKLLVPFLLNAHLYGVPNCIPRIDFATAQNKQDASDDLAGQADNAIKQVQKRLGLADGCLNKVVSTTSDKQKKAIYADAAKALFGKAFVMFPLFVPLNSNELLQQLNLSADKKLMRYKGFRALADWKQAISKVRKQMKALYNVEINQILSGDLSFTYEPVQLPYKQDDYWVGTEFPDGYSAGDDQLSVMLISPEEWKNNTPNKAALVVDEWVEILPNKIETTGISINYDNPNACAPQSVLLAVTPVETGKWQFENLVYTLIDTLEMAKNRAVEPDNLEQSPLSHVLPTIISEIAPAEFYNPGEPSPMGVQVTTDFSFNNIPDKI